MSIITSQWVDTSELGSTLRTNYVILAMRVYLPGHQPINQHVARDVCMPYGIIIMIYQFLLHRYPNQCSHALYRVDIHHLSCPYLVEAGQMNTRQPGDSQLHLFLGHVQWFRCCLDNWTPVCLIWYLDTLQLPTYTRTESNMASVSMLCIGQSRASYVVYCLLMCICTYKSASVKCSASQSILPNSFLAQTIVEVAICSSPTAHSEIRPSARISLPYLRDSSFFSAR